MNGNTVHPANTTTTTPGGGEGGGLGLATPPKGWREFCELHAIATARELAGHYRSFTRERPQQDAIPPELFSKQFAHLFQQHFCCEVDKDGAHLHPTTCCPTTTESTSSSTPAGPPCPSPPHAVIGRRPANSNLLGAPDYRETVRPSSSASFFAVLPLKAEACAIREQEQPLRCSAASPALGTPVVLRRTVHSASGGTERCQPNERYSCDGTGSGPGHPEVTHFSKRHIKQNVERLFAGRPLPPSPQHRPSPRNPITDDNNSSTPHANGDRVGGVSSSTMEEETPLLSSSLVASSPSSSSSSCSNPEATPPSITPHKLKGGNFFDRLRRLGSRRQRRVESSSCCKEGQLRYLLVEDNISDGPPNWHRCRLLVRRTRDTLAGGGDGGERYQLELYDPPK
ncbi:hypothetical protein NHX12_029274, partial [Muraenolepis orangiensis]